MPAGPAIVVGHVGRDQLGPAADVLARAFADEALFEYLLTGTHEQRVRALRPFIRGIVSGHLRFGEVHRAMVDDEIGGVAIRLPPGGFPLTTLDTVRMAVRALPGFVRMTLARPGARRLPTAMADLEKKHPRDQPHWYLAMVGVDRAYRRRGVATALARFVLDRADQESVACYLDTFGEGTKRLYEQYGFRVAQEIRPFSDGPLGWGMWRAPRGPDAA